MDVKENGIPTAAYLSTAQTFSILLLVGATVATKSLIGVDPNTLSCDPEGHEFLLLPHYTDCNKFYVCALGVEIEMTCSSGTIFDFILQVCDHESDTECILRTPDEDIEGSGEGSGDSDEENVWWPLKEGEIKNDPMDELAHLNGLVDEIRLMPIEPAFVVNTVLDCRSADAASKQNAYAGDCQRYWRCIDGTPHTAYCSDGLFFNEATQQCDFEANVRCNDQLDDELKGEFIAY